MALALKLAIFHTSCGRSGHICRTMSDNTVKKLVFLAICAKVPDVELNRADMSVGNLDFRAMSQFLNKR
jgi:hypothetical protein